MSYRLKIQIDEPSSPTVRFEQIQHAAIVGYNSPLTGGETLVGVYYSKAKTFAYFRDDRWHHLPVTGSQKCRVIHNALSLCERVCKENYINEHEKAKDIEEFVVKNKMTIEEMSDVLVKVAIDLTLGDLKFGQSLYNNLPEDLAKEINSTSLDPFHRKGHKGKWWTKFYAAVLLDQEKEEDTDELDEDSEWTKEDVKCVYCNKATTEYTVCEQCLTEIDPLDFTKSVELL